LLVGVGLAVLALVGVVAALTLGGGDDDPPDNAAAETTTSVTQATTTTTAPTTSTTEAHEGPFVEIQSVDLGPDDKYVVNYAVTGYTPDVEDPEALHIHFFLNTTDPENAGINGNPPGTWDLTDVLNTYETPFGPATKGAATQMCSAVAEHDHSVFEQGTLTGNCVDLPA
jgi:hypothetical protein